MKKIYISLLCVVATLFFAARVSAQMSEPIGKMDIPAVTGAVAFDGVADEAWWGPETGMKLAKRAGVANPAGLEDGDATDFNVKFRTAWDLTYLYVFVEVTDDIEESMPVGGANAWTWDNFEVFIDLDTNSTTKTYSATSTVQLRFNRGDVGVESPGRAAKTDYQFFQDNGTSYWIYELAIPWTSADSVGDGRDMLAIQTRGVIGFDIAVADGDGAGTGTEGGRNIAGGAQMFWEQDTPIENADNAYQDRRCLGIVTLTGTPVSGSGINTPKVTSYSVYPSPSNGTVTFANLNGVKSFDIYNLVGVKVMTVDVIGSQVKVNGLKSGVYFANIKGEVTKFIVE